MIVFKVIYLDFYIPLLCFGTQLSPRPSSWGWWDMRTSYFRFACCKYVPTILSESLAQARVAGTLQPKGNVKFGSHIRVFPPHQGMLLVTTFWFILLKRIIKYHYIMFSNSCNCKRVNSCIKSGSTSETRSH